MDNEIVRLVILPIVVVLLAYVNEKGFENMISQPIIERWLKALKPFQPYLVAITGILLAYAAKTMGVDIVPDLSQYVNMGGDIVTVFSGLLIAVISMALHNRNKTYVAFG